MGYLRLRQICLVAPALAAPEKAFKSILGLEPCYRDPNVGHYGLENVLFPVGHDFIEIVAPTRTGTAAGRFLEQRGGRGGYMVILDCDDPQRRRRHVESIGVRVANLLEYDSYYGVQLHPRDTGAAMIEFNNTPGGEKIDGPYHPAGPEWQKAVRTDVTSRLLAVEIEAPDPAGVATQWGRVLEVPVTQIDPDRHRLAVGESQIRFSRNAALDQAMFTGIEVRVADRYSVLQAARGEGCVTDESGFELCGIRIALS